MPDGLDVVAIRIEDESGVVAGVIAALARASVVAAAGAQSGPMERLDRCAVGRLKRKVDARQMLSPCVAKPPTAKRPKPYQGFSIM